MSRRSKKRVFTEVVVIDAGAKGKSVAKADDGRVIFLSNAVPGDVVDIETFKKRKSFFEGKAINFHTLSDKRTTPKCEHFGVCGGCKWQHMDYKWQLHYKQNEVENNLKRIGHLNLPNISPIIPSKNDYFYRNKMEFSFSNNRWLTSDEIASDNDLGDRNALGFHIPGMWDKILDINKCWLQADPSNAIRNAVKSFAVENNLEFFDTRKQAGLLRTMMIRTTSTGELMVLIQFYNDDKEKRELLLNYIS
ncbi:MAG: class I SAM-dependent RNA methyltransferase, partial [Winogradskyella sp.]|nr:class I SAM-dependent RNA methyltransferase [Winogradskyella sp.]